DRLGVHVGLFVATFLSMIWAGGTWVGRVALWPDGADLAGMESPWAAWAAYQVQLLQSPVFLRDGLVYAVSFIGFLTVHEFGHYLTARWRRTRVSLPYYIPIPFPHSLGTLGAVIRIKEPLRRTRQLFDIGAAGPLAGFVVALGVLLLGTFTLPPAADLLAEVGNLDDAVYYVQYGDFPPLDYAPPGAAPQGIAYLFGNTPLYALVNGLGAYEVPAHEMMHYPLLLAGWLGLFFTALNLLPVGQLDGGHIVYALFGPTVHAIVARVTTLVLLLSGGLGFIGDMAASMPPWQLWSSLGLIYALAFARLFDGLWRLVVPAVMGALALTALIVTATPGLAASVGWFGWIVWVGLILFVIRVDHPPVQVEEALTPGRMALGYLCLLIFALCFSIQPITTG
ncbi:MAG: site-2 protease family protein, partial [Bacteroidota bacterium]